LSVLPMQYTVGGPTTMAVPGDPWMQFDNETDHTQATKLWVNPIDAITETSLATLAPGSLLVTQHAYDPTRWQRYKLTGYPITNPDQPVELPIQWQTGGGADQVGDTDPVVLALYRQGEGPPGPPGPAGPAGPQGPVGSGFPTGGTYGQVLVKLSAADYDFAWADPTGTSQPGPPGDQMWQGHGPPDPAALPNANPGDDYLDVDTGDIYELS
jgi:hypothetical protein